MVSVCHTDASFVSNTEFLSANSPTEVTVQRLLPNNKEQSSGSSPGVSDPKNHSLPSRPVSSSLWGGSISGCPVRVTVVLLELSRSMVSKQSHVDLIA